VKRGIVGTSLERRQYAASSRGRYQPIIPTFIVGWHPERLRVQLAFKRSWGPIVIGGSEEGTKEPSI